MKSENEEKMSVFIVQSFGTALSDKKVLNAIKDFQENVICWDSKENAMSFILEAGFEDHFMAVEVDLEKYQEFLDGLNKKYNTELKIKLISGVEFDRF